VTAPVITFLSDYGLADEFVAVCHGVIASLCPPARVIDITHGVPRHDVRAGALLLRSALRFMPTGVHLAVVDPEVGAARRAVALRVADHRVLVGPDNGLLSLAAVACGGVTEAVDIAKSRFRLEPVSATFHGRDIFAPVAARLAAGATLAQAGEPCDPSELAAVEIPAPEVCDGELRVRVVYIDRFGNAQLGADHDVLTGIGIQLGRPVEVRRREGGAPHRGRFVTTFADVAAGELLVYEDATRTPALAVSHGSAASLLGLAVDDEVSITPL
jgi:S-adenosylmethionine hydrolase